MVCENNNEVYNWENSEEVEEVEYLVVEENRFINWENVDEVVYSEDDVDDLYMFIEIIVKEKLGEIDMFRNDEDGMDEMSNKINNKLQDLGVAENGDDGEYFESVVKYLKELWFENGRWNINDGGKQKIYEVINMVLSEE